MRTVRMVAVLVAGNLAAGGLMLASRSGGATPSAAPVPTPSVRPSSPAPVTTPTPSPVPPSPTTSPTPRPVPYHPASPPALPHDGLRDVTLALTAPRFVATATTATLRIDVRQSWQTMFELDWGDGTKGGQMAIDCGPAYPPGASPSPRPTPANPRSWHTTLTHAFRYPGVYYAVVRVQHQCEGPEGANVRAVRIVVTRGRDLSNGPEAPRAEIYADYTSADGWDVFVYDDDGWVRRIVVDWGDGSRPTTHVFGYGGCHAKRWQWPVAYGLTTLHHAFATGGPHDVKIRVTSYGCTGHDRQRTVDGLVAVR